MNAKKKVFSVGEFQFEGVNPDLLRITSPLHPSETPAPPQKLEETPKPADVPRETVTAPVTAPGVPSENLQHKHFHMTGQAKDPYGIRQGKEACLRSVIQRIRSGKMNSVEEAKALHFLIQNNVVASQTELATAMGLSKSKISEKLAILRLPRSVLILIERNPDAVTEGHAVELLRLKDPALVTNVAMRIIEQNLSRDRLRTEISFLLEKHGGEEASFKKPMDKDASVLRYSPREDGGFDLMVRFNPKSSQEELTDLIHELESKTQQLKNILTSRLREKSKTRAVSAPMSSGHPAIKVISV